MKNFSLIFLLMAGTALFFSECQKKKEYIIENYFSKSESDTIMVNILTYVAKKPKTADWKTRHEPRFRNYYINQLSAYEMKFFHQANDSVNYFYMIRPARSPKGNKRGVGGKFIVDHDFKIKDFEEIFNTPVMSEDSLEIVGKKLFSELLKNESLDVNHHKAFIEWPDERLKYDKSINDWIYIK